MINISRENIYQNFFRLSSFLSFVFIASLDVWLPLHVVQATAGGHLFTAKANQLQSQSHTEHLQTGPFWKMHVGFTHTHTHKITLYNRESHFFLCAQKLFMAYLQPWNVIVFLWGWHSWKKGEQGNSQASLTTATCQSTSTYSECYFIHTHTHTLMYPLLITA